MTDQPRPKLAIGGAGPIALASAVLFGLTVPAAKLLMDAIDPWLLAGICYLGSGIGLFGFRLAATRGRTREEPVSGGDWPWLAGAIFFGGVVGPVLLFWGLARVSASSASLLLTMEGVLTALLAWAVFREHYHGRVAVGMAAIAAGARVLAWAPDLALDDLLGSAAVVAACLAWAMDNNLTRKVSIKDPTQIAMLKGLAAGTINTVLAWGQGVAIPDPLPLLGAASIGFLGYGVSLVFFVLALRMIGTARTGAYFSTAPFIGAVASVLLLDEPITVQVIAGGILMAIGVGLHLTERHAHAHTHRAMEHAHSHRHDAHHQHRHGSNDPQGEPHTHEHRHQPIRHAHPHFPDSHHLHDH
jgi:drug/metabolite transporter (DMT)-like permease